MSEKISAGEVRVGNVLKVNGDLFKVLTTEHVKPGKGGAFTQVSMKRLDGEQKLNLRHRVEENLEKESIYEVKVNFGYSENDDLVFFNVNTYETMTISKKKVLFWEVLTESMEVSLLVTSEGDCIGVRFPNKIKVLVKEAPAYIKGQTATATDKIVILENGFKIKTPQYVEKDDEIIIRIDEDEEIAVFVEKIRD